MDLGLEIKMQGIVQPFFDKYPDRRVTILEEMELCIDEINDGSGWDHETSLMVESLTDQLGEV